MIQATRGKGDEEVSLFKKNIYDTDLAEKLNSVSELPTDVGIEQVFAEMYQVIQHCSYSVKRKIPDKFINFLKENMDEQWKGDLDFSLDLHEMNLLEDTRAMISLVYRDFLCTEAERQGMIEKDRLEAEASGYLYEEQSLMDLIRLIS